MSMTFPANTAVACLSAVLGDGGAGQSQANADPDLYPKIGSPRSTTEVIDLYLNRFTLWV
jgi:hypothetical protein